MRVAALALAGTFVFQGALPGSIAAGDPPPPTQELTPALELTVGGPAQASAGSAIVYTVDYRILDPGHPTWTFRAFVEQPLSFVSASVASGDGSCVFTATGDGEGAADCTVGSIDAPSGRAEITVWVAEAFQGDASLTAFVPGASIDMADSVLTAATRVVASTVTPSPAADSGPSPKSDPAWPAWLAGLGAAAILAVAAGAVLVARRR